MRTKKKTVRSRRVAPRRPTSQGSWVVDLEIVIREMPTQIPQVTVPEDEMNTIILKHQIMPLRVSAWLQTGQLCVTACVGDSELQSVAWRIPIKNWSGWMSLDQLWNERGEVWDCRARIRSAPHPTR